jgi:hypothetical protein
MKKFIAIYSFPEGYKESIMVENVEIDEEEAKEEGVSLYDFAYEILERNDATLILLTEEEAKILIKKLTESL